MNLGLKPDAVRVRENLFSPAVRGPGPKFEVWFAEDIVVPRDKAMIIAENMIAHVQGSLDSYRLEKHR